MEEKESKFTILKATDDVIRDLIHMVKLMKREDRSIFREALVGKDTYNMLTLIIKANKINDSADEGKRQRMELLTEYLVQLEFVSNVIKLAVETGALTIKAEARFMLIADGAQRQALAWKKHYEKQLSTTQD